MAAGYLTKNESPANLHLWASISIYQQLLLLSARNENETSLNSRHDFDIHHVRLTQENPVTISNVTPSRYVSAVPYSAAFVIHYASGAV